MVLLADPMVRRSIPRRKCGGSDYEKPNAAARNRYRSTSTLIDEPKRAMPDVREVRRVTSPRKNDQRRHVAGRGTDHHRVFDDYGRRPGRILTNSPIRVQWL